LNAEQNPPNIPQAWLRTPLGEYFLAWEQACLDAILTDIFGYNALQIGLADQDLLRANRIPLHVCARRAPGQSDESAPASRVTVLTDEAALPFVSASFDLVVLAHALEFSDYPHQILREAERILVPGGSVVVCGFNPFSLWGLRSRCSRGHGQWPWSGRYLSASKLRDWLTLFGFEVQSGCFGCYVPPVDVPEWLARWKWLDHVGRRCWLVCGAVWMLHGIKRVSGVRLIQPNWRDKCIRAKSFPVAVRRVGEIGEINEISEKTGKTWKS
jgi:SAM-dependent methyltransferase